MASQVQPPTSPIASQSTPYSPTLQRPQSPAASEAPAASELPKEPGTSVRLLMGIRNPSPVEERPPRASSASPDASQKERPSAHARAYSLPAAPPSRGLQLPSLATVLEKARLTARAKVPSTAHSRSASGPHKRTPSPIEAQLYKVDKTAMEAHRAAVELAKRKRVASITPVRAELQPFRPSHAQRPSLSSQQDDGKRLQEEAQTSFEALATEFAIIDEFVLLAQTQASRASRTEILERRQAAVEYCNQLHLRCELAGVHIWCPSEQNILSFQRHVEEDLGALQGEIHSLAVRGRNCDHLTKLRSKLLQQRYFWRVRLNAIELE